MTSTPNNNEDSFGENPLSEVCKCIEMHAVEITTYFYEASLDLYHEFCPSGWKRGVNRGKNHKILNRVFERKEDHISIVN